MQRVSNKPTMTRKEYKRVARQNQQQNEYARMRHNFTRGSAHTHRQQAAALQTASSTPVVGIWTRIRNWLGKYFHRGPRS